MEKHVLFTFSHGVEQGDERAFLQENNVALSGKTFRSGGTDFAGPAAAAESESGGRSGGLEPSENSCTRRIPSQLRAQALHQSAKSFFVAPVPAPLALLHGLDQASLGENGHVMRDGGLGKAHAFFNVAGAEARVFPIRACRLAERAALFERCRMRRRVGSAMAWSVWSRDVGTWSWGLEISVKLTIVNMLE